MERFDLFININIILKKKLLVCAEACTSERVACEVVSCPNADLHDSV